MEPESTAFMRGWTERSLQTTLNRSSQEDARDQGQASRKVLTGVSTWLLPPALQGGVRASLCPLSHRDKGCALSDRTEPGLEAPGARPLPPTCAMSISPLCLCSGL